MATATADVAAKDALIALSNADTVTLKDAVRNNAFLKEVDTNGVKYKMNGGKIEVKGAADSEYKALFDVDPNDPKKFEIQASDDIKAKLKNTVDSLVKDWENKQTTKKTGRLTPAKKQASIKNRNAAEAQITNFARDHVQAVRKELEQDVVTEEAGRERAAQDGLDTYKTVTRRTAEGIDELRQHVNDEFADADFFGRTDEANDTKSRVDNLAQAFQMSSQKVSASLGSRLDAAQKQAVDDVAILTKPDTTKTDVVEQNRQAVADRAVGAAEDYAPMADNIKDTGFDSLDRYVSVFNKYWLPEGMVAAFKESVPNTMAEFKALETEGEFKNIRRQFGLIKKLATDTRKGTIVGPKFDGDIEGMEQKLRPRKLGGESFIDQQTAKYKSQTGQQQHAVLTSGDRSQIATGGMSVTQQSAPSQNSQFPTNPGAQPGAGSGINGGGFAGNGGGGGGGGAYGATNPETYTGRDLDPTRENPYGRGDVFQSGDPMDNSHDSLRPMYKMEVPSNVIPSVNDQLASDIRFDMFDSVHPGFGNGEDNKLFLMQEARDQKIRYAQPLFQSPGEYIGPLGAIQTPAWQMQRVMHPSLIRAHEGQTQARVNNTQRLLRSNGDRSSHVLGYDKGYPFSVSSKGLPRDKFSPLEPVINTDIEWEHVKMPTGANLNVRDFRRPTNSLRRPRDLSGMDEGQGGPHLKKGRSLEVILP